MQGYPTSPDPQQTPQPAPQPALPQYPPTLAPAWSAPNPPPPLTNQPRPPQSNRNKLLIGGGIGCGALLILCMCVGLISALAANGGNSSASGGSPTATQQQSQTQKLVGTPKPTTTPKPTATATPQPKWVVTHTFKGNGIQKTDTFTVNSDHWRIAWSCNPKAYGFEYNLIADLTPPGEDFGDSVVNVICKSNDPSSISGETNEYSSGTYFLDVTSEGPWVFQVEEFK